MSNDDKPERGDEQPSLTAPLPPIPRGRNQSDPGPDRRARQRVAIRVEVNLGTESNFFTGYSEDLSDGGLFVATYDLKPVGTDIGITLDLEDERRVRATGRVVWVRDSQDRSVQPGMGIRFDALRPDDREAVLAFVRRRDPLFYDE